MLVRRDEDSPILVAIVHPEVSALRGQGSSVRQEFVLEVVEGWAVDVFAEKLVLLLRDRLVIHGAGRDRGHEDWPPIVVHSDIPDHRRIPLLAKEPVSDAGVVPTVPNVNAVAEPAHPRKPRRLERFDHSTQLLVRFRVLHVLPVLVLHHPRQKHVLEPSHQRWPGAMKDFGDAIPDAPQREVPQRRHEQHREREWVLRGVLHDLGVRIHLVPELLVHGERHADAVLKTIAHIFVLVGVLGQLVVGRVLQTTVVIGPVDALLELVPPLRLPLFIRLVAVSGHTLLVRLARLHDPRAIEDRNLQRVDIDLSPRRAQLCTKHRCPEEELIGLRVSCCVWPKQG